MANPEKWSNTLKQTVGNLPTVCLSVFDHFMNLALKELIPAPFNSYCFCNGLMVSGKFCDYEYFLIIAFSKKMSMKKFAFS